MNERKLDTADTISDAFSIYGRQAGVLLPVAFGLFLIVAVVRGLFGDEIALFPLVIAVSTIASTLYQGMVVELVHDVQDGRRDSSIGELVRSAGPVILPLFLAGLLVGIGVGLGFLLLVVPGLILLTIWSVVAPVIVVERKGVLDSFGRSRELVRGHGWQVFGVIVTVFLIVFVVSIVLAALASGVDDSTGVRIAFDAIGSTLTAPITALVAGVLYFRLRTLHEGDAPSTPAAPEPGPTAV
jgi:Uncharacterised protein family (UPF0259)